MARSPERKCPPAVAPRPPVRLEAVVHGGWQSVYAFSMRRVRIVNASRGSVLAEEAEVAETPSARRRGLLGRDSLPEGGGLLIVPCRQVHSFGMRFAVDVVFLDRALKVIRAVREFPPGRLSPLVFRSRAVLELPAGTLERTGTRVGDPLDIRTL